MLTNLRLRAEDWQVYFFRTSSLRDITVTIGASVASYAFKADLIFRRGRWAVGGGFSAWAGIRVYGQIRGQGGAEINYNSCTGEPSLQFKLIVAGEVGLEVGGEATAYLVLSYRRLSIKKRFTVGVAGGGRLGVEWDADVSCSRSECVASGPVRIGFEAYIRAVLLGFNAEIGIKTQKEIDNYSMKGPSPLGFLP